MEERPKIGNQARMSEILVAWRSNNNQPYRLWQTRRPWLTKSSARKRCLLVVHFLFDISFWLYPAFVRRKGRSVERGTLGHLIADETHRWKNSNPGRGAASADANGVRCLAFGDQTLNSSQKSPPTYPPRAEGGPWSWTKEKKWIQLNDLVTKQEITWPLCSILTLWLRVAIRKQQMRRIIDDYTCFMTRVEFESPVSSSHARFLFYLEAFRPISSAVAAVRVIYHTRFSEFFSPDRKEF